MNDAAAHLTGFQKEYAFLLLGLGLGFFVGWMVARIGRPPQQGGMANPANAAEAASISDAQAIDVVVNGKMIRLPPDTAGDIRRLLRDRKPGEAIRRLRETTGLRATEAKAVIDSLGRIQG